MYFHKKGCEATLHDRVDFRLGCPTNEDDRTRTTSGAERSEKDEERRTNIWAGSTEIRRDQRSVKNFFLEQKKTPTLVSQNANKKTKKWIL